MNTTVRERPVLLSPRQRQVLLAYADGLKSGQVGKRLGITAATAAHHINELSLVVGSKRPQGVLAQVVRLGLLQPEPSAPVVLTDDELALVELLADGNSEMDIARRTGLPRSRVRRELAAVGAKLSAATPAQIVWRAAACAARMVQVTR